MGHDLLLHTLDTLFTLSQDGRETSVLAVALHVGASEAAVADALHHLESRGLVDAGRARLTMRGLAAAATLRAHVQRFELSAAA